MKNNIQKHQLVKFINNDLNKSIAYFDILSVLNILIEELINELKINNEFQITNLGTFKLININSKKIINVTNQQKITTQPTKALRLYLSKRLINYIKGY